LRTNETFRAKYAKTLSIFAVFASLRALRETVRVFGEDMRRILILILVLAVAAVMQAQSRGLTANAASPHAKMKSVDMDAVHWTRGFWADRFDLANRVMIPSQWQSLQLLNNGASFRNFRIAAGLEKAEFQSTFWSDGDVYKWLEAVAHVYAITRDAALDRRMDEVIATIGKAQAPDGYIATEIQLTDKKRWSDMRYHETYNMGHLFTAACIHHRATGKDSLLKIARKNADYLYGVFKPQTKELAQLDFNPSQIMGLVELYRTTGEPKYLELAGIFVSLRGSARGGSDLNQNRTPLRKESEAVGHVVTACYLYAGAADIYAETGETALWNALDRIWHSAITQKMYVTGAVGALNHGVSSHHDDVHEAFGLEYELPNRIGYNETCANIANAMWNWRMLQATGDPRYADVMELVFYNSMLSGMGLSGKDFFYANPLRRFGKDMRMLQNESLERWVDSTSPGASKSYCCPPNVLRTLASMHEYAYGTANDAVYVNLYGSNSLKTGALSLEQETDYPWDGRVQLTVKAAAHKEVSLRLRIPAWAEGAALKVNGKAMPAPRAGTYAEVRRVWAAGDTVELVLPMKPRLIEANPTVEEARNQVAVMRGPIVYCLESPDLGPGVKFTEVAIPADIRLSARFDKELLGGVTVLAGKGKLAQEDDWSGLLYRMLRPASGSVDVKLIPYYAWANRGISYMTVWMPLAGR
jgi:DUF1680 family protein